VERGLSFGHWGIGCIRGIGGLPFEVLGVVRQGRGGLATGGSPTTTTGVDIAARGRVTVDGIDER